MTEQQFDKLALETMINLYNTIDEQIKLLGEDIVRQHAPGLISRRDEIKEYIRSYASLHIEGLAYSNHMSVEEIASHISEQITL